jgi:predicted phage terminase large subunit-like protein
MATHWSKNYAAILRNDFTAFLQRAFLELYPQKQFDSNWHIELMATKLEEVRRGRCTRLIICIPPRHFKSFVFSVALPAWLLGHDPAMRIMTVSYAQDLADEFARGSRRLMESAFYQALFATRLSPDRNAVYDFETTQGGGRFSTSMGGEITGRGGQILIIDEPLKADDAHSDAKRQGANRIYDDSLCNRLNRPGVDAIILVAQRLHVDDLVAHVQRTETWDVVSLPAIAEREEHYSFMTPYGQRKVIRKVGEVINPAILPASKIDHQRRVMTEYNFSAQYQQDPQPASGLIVKRRWLRYYSDRDKPDRFDTIVQSWDTAIKATELSDYSVCTTWGVKSRRMYLLDVFRRRLEFPELRRMVFELSALWNPDIVLVEDKASGTQLIQELRADGFSRVQAAPSLDGDKIMRLRAQTAKIEGGFVLFPLEAHWLNDYLRELLSFPNSEFDDQVDSTVFALAWTTLFPRWEWTDEAVNNLFQLALPF